METFKRLSKNHEFYKESEDNSELNRRSLFYDEGDMEEVSQK
jgi:hypothetical protein